MDEGRETPTRRSEFVFVENDGVDRGRLLRTSDWAFDAVLASVASERRLHAEARHRLLAELATLQPQPATAENDDAADHSDDEKAADDGNEDSDDDAASPAAVQRLLAEISDPQLRAIDDDDDAFDGLLRRYLAAEFNVENAADDAAADADGDGDDNGNDNCGAAASSASEPTAEDVACALRALPEARRAALQQQAQQQYPEISPEAQRVVDDLFTCPICFEPFREPAQLRQCAHVFEKDMLLICLREARTAATTAAAGGDAVAPCPICRRAFGASDVVPCPQNKERLDAFLQRERAAALASRARFVECRVREELARRRAVDAAEEANRSAFRARFDRQDAARGRRLARCVDLRLQVRQAEAQRRSRERELRERLAAAAITAAASRARTRSRESRAARLPPPPVPMLQPSMDLAAALRQLSALEQRDAAAAQRELRLRRAMTATAATTTAVTAGAGSELGTGAGAGGLLTARTTAARNGAGRRVGALWEPNSARCHNCERPFTLLTRGHHCRRCGNNFCHACCHRLGLHYSFAATAMATAAAATRQQRDGRASEAGPDVWSRLCGRCAAVCGRVMAVHHQRQRQHDSGRDVAPLCASSDAPPPAMDDGRDFFFVARPWLERQMAIDAVAIAELRLLPHAAADAAVNALETLGTHLRYFTDWSVDALARWHAHAQEQRRAASATHSSGARGFDGCREAAICCEGEGDASRTPLVHQVRWGVPPLALPQRERSVPVRSSFDASRHTFAVGE